MRQLSIALPGAMAVLPAPSGGAAATAFTLVAGSLQSTVVNPDGRA
jgi:hypothetical protein